MASSSRRERPVPSSEEASSAASRISEEVESMATGVLLFSFFPSLLFCFLCMRDRKRECVRACAYVLALSRERKMAREQVQREREKEREEKKNESERAISFFYFFLH